MKKIAVLIAITFGLGWLHFHRPAQAPAKPAVAQKAEVPKAVPITAPAKPVPAAVKAMPPQAATQQPTALELLLRGERIVEAKTK